MVETIHSWNLYEIPSQSFRHKRNEFFRLQRKHSEPIDKWLKRVEIHMGSFDIPKIAEYLVVEKFMSKLKSDELLSFKRVSSTWSLKQLKQYIHQHMACAYPAPIRDETVNRNIGETILSTDVIKCERVSRAYSNSILKHQTFILLKLVVLTFFIYKLFRLMLQTEGDEYSVCGLAEEENRMVEILPYGDDDDPLYDEEEHEENDQQPISTQYTLHSSTVSEKSDGIPDAVEKCFRIDAIKCELVSFVSNISVPLNQIAEF